ncbi:PEP-CTERM sorting domain-containing protein [Rubritalea spongiae]|uniref:PEP-CTERM sorting domain-containing protein n=1 Tax=Rubritalea spongiae TaxID=430797 RepID=A0ABW5E1A1_9BACT
MNTFSLSTLLTVGFSISSAHAATLALYNFESSTLSDSASVTDITATDLNVVSNGFTVNTLFHTGGNALGNASLGGSEAEFGFTTAGQSVDLSFDLSTSASYTLDSISFQHRANNSTNAFDSHNLSVSDGVTTLNLIINELTNPLNQWNEYSASLQGTAFETLDAGTTLTFTIRLAGKSSNGAGNSFSGIDDITVTKVPEPSSTALLGLGGLALVLRRRR